MAVKVVTCAVSNPSRDCSRFQSVWKSSPVPTRRSVERATSPATKPPLSFLLTEREPVPREAACSAAWGLARATSRAGSRDDSTVVTMAIAASTSTTVQRMAIASARGMVPSGSLCTASMATCASPAPAPQPRRLSAIPSESICRIRRSRLAPSAALTANSCWRPRQRAIIRFDTFAQAINSTSARAPNSP